MSQQRRDHQVCTPCSLSLVLFALPTSRCTEWPLVLRNATEHAARHVDNSLISHVLASHAPSIFREMRHCTFVCTENAPLYFRFFGQQG